MSRLLKPTVVAGLLLVTGCACWVMCTPVVPTRHVASVSQTNVETAASAAPAANGGDRAEPNKPVLHNKVLPDNLTHPDNAAVADGARSGQPSEQETPHNAPVEVRSALLSTVPRGNPSPESLAISQATSTDPRSLALLSTLERDLHRAPPPEVHALVRAHAQGASREQLLARLEQTLAQEISIKLYVRRWIDEVAPDPKQPPAARTPLLSKGAGTGWVAPITPR